MAAGLTAGVLACGSTTGSSDPGQAPDAADPGDVAPADPATEAVAPDATGEFPDATAETPDALADAPLDLPADAPDACAGDACPPDPDGAPFARWVNPFIGSGSILGNIGNSYPGAAAPFGLVKASPDTTDSTGAPVFSHCAGYKYSDPLTYGVSHNHLQGTGIPDYGNVRIQPVVGMTDAKTARDGYRAPFTHDGEAAAVGYYRHVLTDPRVTVEVTATPRCAVHRYRFDPAIAAGTLLVDASSALLGGHVKGGQLAWDAATSTLTGQAWNVGEFSGRYGGFPIFFKAVFQGTVQGFGTWVDGHVQDGRAQVSTDADPSSLGAYVTFDTAAAAPSPTVQICLSYTSAAGADAAFQAEVAGRDVDAVRAGTQAAWEALLGQVEVTGGSTDDKANFYTALYHAYQMPTTWSDVDGSYYGFDRQVHAATGWTYSTDMSLWDTFRTAIPLYTLLMPDRQRDMLRSLTAMKADGGYVPMWPMGAGDTGCMIGEHAAAMAADSWLKGVHDFDVETLWAGLKQTADGPLPAGGYGGRGCLADYLSLGYCSVDTEGGSVAKTLEYSFDDFCLARLAGSLGKTDDQARYDGRAQSYRTLFDPSVGFFRARHKDGSWEQTFQADAYDWNNDYYIEGSAWQWLWFVPHDEAGLRGLLGGDGPFVDKLTEFLQQGKDNFSFYAPDGYYFHGNEPDFHAMYLFIRAGRPDLAQDWAAWARQVNYLNQPDGLSGNDDAGTMGAWYAFTALGLFPWPCVPGYYVTAPAFDRVVLHLAGADVVVDAPGAGSGRRHVKSATWNGKGLDVLWIDHADLVQGGTLALQMVD